jgi:hypothetical protein
MKINEYLGVDWYDTFNVEDYFYILEDYYISSLCVPCGRYF